MRARSSCALALGFLTFAVQGTVDHSVPDKTVPKRRESPRWSHNPYSWTIPKNAEGDASFNPSSLLSESPDPASSPVSSSSSSSVSTQGYFLDSDYNDNNDDSADQILEEFKLYVAHVGFDNNLDPITIQANLIYILEDFGVTPTLLDWNAPYIYEVTIHDHPQSDFSQTLQSELKRNHFITAVRKPDAIAEYIQRKMYYFAMSELQCQSDLPQWMMRPTLDHSGQSYLFY